jgi:hypothetical protein
MKTIDKINTLIKKVELLQSQGSFDVTVPLEIGEKKYQCNLHQLYDLKRKYESLENIAYDIIKNQ